ncbi:phosphatidylinositol N-acetylglucosaminyltransferase subunit A [Ricinus communis]|uniref:Glycosyltransferase, putative n=1 Tax=Ricinus communis TaxID=3988 RepID=B9SE46_RICCO|nr:phosphatidylinositol N-acetylglucosaminyltransferase subunit A [Ricinus communis]EEF38100.1 glycosyltransferase, putative [Ricinus communis]|eukprot:XP_002524261.1 phosphatidylinositol N-acetylglucosaminyltransferase subunit A [Ricinus communis]
MGFKHQTHKTTSSSNSFSVRFSTILILTLFFTSFYLFISPLRHVNQEPTIFPGKTTSFSGDLRDAKFPWNKLSFGPTFEKLKLAVFSKTWPIGAAPGGMERHASTLYHALAARGHEIHVFTVPSDRKPHVDVHVGNLHVYFAANDHGSVNCSLAFEIFNKVNSNGAFDYVHTESVSLPHWRAKMVPNLAVTWHGIWYEIMHSKLFEELFSNPNGFLPGPMTELQESMPRLLDEIRFFSSYKQHICISNSAGEVLVNIYQLPQRNVHVILNGVDNTKFVHNPEAGTRFRRRYGILDDVSLVMGIAGRLVRDKGHPLLYEAFSMILKRHPNVCLLVAGSGPWGRRYAELGPNVKVLGALESSQLSEFYNAIDVFVNPTLRPQGLDLTLIEAMHCGKPVLAPNYPSIVGTVVVDENFGYTFSPNVKSLVEALELVIRDGPVLLQKKGMACKEYALSMFTATKMAAAYERFFLCMKTSRYCQYPFPTD